MFDRIARWLREPARPDAQPGPRHRTLEKITLIGPPGHGKTTFLHSLMGSLSQLGAVWSHWHCRISQELDTKLRYQAIEARNRKIPEPSGDTVESYSALLQGLPRWGDRPLSLTELGRYHSRSRQRDLTYRVASTAPVEMILISLEELRNDPLARLDTVIAGCLWPPDSTGALRIRSSKILVLTQADRCLWPPEIHEYLLNDPFRGLWPDTNSLTTYGDASISPLPLVPLGQDPAAHLEQMKIQDARLRDWLASTRGGPSALERFAEAGVDLRVCAISSLGSHPVGSKLLLPWRPRCVLDPLFWAFEMTSL